jgi:hypothetical protein
MMKKTRKILCVWACREKIDFFFVDKQEKEDVIHRPYIFAYLQNDQNIPLAV